jgi:serine/threonine protein phosphatase PrpC
MKQNIIRLLWEDKAYHEARSFFSAVFRARLLTMQKTVQFGLLNKMSQAYLLRSRPTENKDMECLGYPGVIYEVAVISEKGLRSQMEDTHYVDLCFADKDWVFAGVYDGHNGPFAAQHAARRLHEIFLCQLLLDGSPQKAFRRSYELISEELKTQDSGTTAVNVLIKEQRVFAANVGDARAIVVNRSGHRQLTVDHRLDNPIELERIKKMGGLVRYPYAYRGDLGLMPTRTIGDRYFKPVGVIALPSVSEHNLSEGDIVAIVACDGLFDVMTNEEIAEMARNCPEAKELVQILKNEVLVNRSGRDNLTIIAISFRSGNY